MQWWCSAQGVSWTWAWQAYPGVWLMVAAIGLLYYRLTRNVASDRRAGVLMGWAGMLILWLSLDWPLGPLAAGYLASAHALQFMLITFIVAPLLLLGIRAVSVNWGPISGVGGRILRLVTQPIVAGVFFNVTTIATHTTGVVDTMMVSQWGAFAIDVGWLVSALCFWWPVVVPVPERIHFNGLFQVLYLFVGTMFHTVIGIIMLMSGTPLYGIYEMAPPMTGLTALQDSQLAGGVMELIGAAIIFPIISYRFFRWAKESEVAEDAKSQR